MNDPVIHGWQVFSRNHQSSQASAASVRAQTDNNFLLVANKALKDILATPLTENKNGRAADNDPMFVTLRAPAAEIQEQLNSKGRLTLLLGSLATLVGDNSVLQLTTRLKNRLAMMASQRRQGEQLSADFQVAFEQAQSAMDVYKNTLGCVASAQKAYRDSAGKLELAEEKLNGLTPDSLGYESLKQQVDTLRNELSVLRNNLDMALSAARAAHNSAKEKTEKLDTITSQMQGGLLTGSYIGQQQTDNLNSIARFTLLLSMFIELVGKNNEESLNNDMALFRTLQESRKEEMLRKSEEYQEETRKAEVLNRTMGCIGKVVGALLTVASVVAAAFTGGAALGLAAASLALILADGIVKASTGTSFIQQALNPVIQHVLKPLMDIVGKVVSEILQKLGVDKAKAEMVGNILGAIVAAVASVAVIVAVAILGKSAVSKLGHVLNKMMGEAIKKLLPDVLKHVMQNGSRILTHGTQRLAGISGSLDKAMLGLRSTNTTLQSGGAVAEGVFLKKASDAFASFTLARFSGEQLRQWLKQAVETFGDNNKITLELQKTLSSVIQQHSDASHFVLRQIRA
ncbi:TPA: type III secretion system translocon subunit SctE [Salmonella enterica subsp. enterica serovar Saintpaul str. CFSAN004144]|nr:type III secretion system translocon subunit SctE [Salmonella enterica subsp. enterica serovar Saintpaul str. CFSAN004144]